MKKMKRIDVFKKTSDNWYPNYPNDMVKISFLKLPNILQNSDAEWRVCIWGNDDFGLERDFQSKKEAMKTFEIISDQDSISADFLLKQLNFWKA